VSWAVLMLFSSQGSVELLELLLLPSLWLNRLFFLTWRGCTTIGNGSNFGNSLQQLAKNRIRAAVVRELANALPDGGIATAATVLEATFAQRVPELSLGQVTAPPLICLV